MRLEDNQEDEDEVEELDDTEKDTFWELRFACDYEFIDENQYIRSITNHGLWKNKMVDGKKVADNNVNYMENMPRAMKVIIAI